MESTTNWPYPNQIALGRGGMANNHEGNKAFRNMVQSYKQHYKYADSPGKKLIIKSVLSELEQNDYHFVELKHGIWVEADVKKARRKVSQTLRERAPGVRRPLVALSMAVQDNSAVAEATVTCNAEDIAAPDTPVAANNVDHNESTVGDNWNPLSNLYKDTLFEDHFGIAENDWVSISFIPVIDNQAESLVQNEEWEDLDLIPLPLDYEPNGTDEQASNDSVLDDAYVDVFLGLFGMLNI